MNKILLLLVMIPVGSYSQKPTEAQIRKYLQNNITVTYYANPNTDKPKGVSMYGFEMAKIKNGIYFGAKNNNKMDKCALLMEALFSTTKGDTRLQETVYYGLQLAGEPIDIYIINDKVKDIEIKYLGNFAVHTLAGDKGSIVNPGTFPKILTTYNTPTIVLGEAGLPGIVKTKEMFCALAAQVGFDMMAPRRRYLFLDITGKGTPKQTLTLGYPVNDTRLLVTQAIANAFSFYYSRPLYYQAARWSGDKRFAASVSRFIGAGSMPENVLLRNVILKADPKLTGSDFKNPPWDFSAKVIKENKHYSDADIIANSDPEKFYFMTDLYAGLCFYEFLRGAGMEKFLGAIKWDNFRLNKAKPEEQLRMMFENLSFVMLNGKTYDELMKSTSLSKNGEAYAMALFDLFGVGAVMAQKVSSYTGFNDKFKLVTGGAFQKGTTGDPVTYYLGKWQTEIQQQTRNLQVNSDLGFFGTVTNVIAKTMGLK